MAKIVFLGTASSIPTKERDNTSFLFIYKKEKFLIDCPGAITQKLLKVGFDFKKIQKIIITHSHPDHIYGIVSLIHTQAYLNKNLTVFSSSSSLRLIQKLITLFKLSSRPYPKITLINVFRRRPFYQENDLILEAIKNKHTKDSFGIKFTFGKKKLFYSSDTSYSPTMLKKTGNITYLIHDCTASSSYFRKHPQLFTMHTHAKQLLHYVKKRPALQLIPIHFLLLARGEEQRIRKELSSLGKQCRLPRDFQVVYL